MAEQETGPQHDPLEQIEEQYKSNISDLLGFYKWMGGVAVAVLTVSVASVAIIEESLKFPWIFVIGWSALVVCIYANVYVMNRLLTIGGVWSTPKELRSEGQNLQLKPEGSMTFFAKLQERSLFFGMVTVLAGFVAEFSF